MNYREIVLELKNKGLIVGDDQTGYNINPYLEMPKSLAFSDVAIMQGKNVCNSRSDANTRSEFVRGGELTTPIVAANMSAVTDAKFCNLLGSLGALGVLHRAWPLASEYILEASKLDGRWRAASVGAGPDQVKLATTLVDAGVNVIVIDIAQGYSPSVIKTGQEIKRLHPDVKLVVGNTINTELMYEVESFADAVKVGIAQGSVCETKNTAGSTMKQWSAVSNFKEVSRKLGLPIISDGSIKEPADFTKAIAAGANSVMAGRIFARCPESAAETVEVNGELKKMYFGMASREAQRRWRGGLKKGTCPEGKTDLIPLGESASDLITRYSGALKSGMTYAGADNVTTFQRVVKFIRV